MFHFLYPSDWIGAQVEDQSIFFFEMDLLIYTFVWLCMITIQNNPYLSHAGPRGSLSDCPLC